MRTSRLDDSLGEKLLERGTIAAEDLRKATLTRRADGRTLAEALIDNRAISRSDLLAAMSEVLSLPAIDLETMPCDPMVLDILPERKAWELRAIPLFAVERQLTVAVTDPTDLHKLDELRFVTGMEILPVVALSDDIDRHLRRLYGSDTSEDDGGDLQFEHVEAAAARADVSLEEAEADRPVVRVVNLIMTRAIQEEASDIHFEPQEKGMTIRYRKDGRLQLKPFQIPPTAAPSVVSRIKVLSGIDISERRRPQDGKIRIRYQGRQIDVRTSTCPTLFGEKVVLRLLDKERQDFRLDSIGMSATILGRWRDLLRRRQGILLVTGPTGSGKSSTLYATLRHLNQPDVNIATLEDPVEYELAGISQSQVNDRAGFTFAGGLRSLLRQDPDIILVGEIRDAETAQIAVQAALTGHLVLATLHTNDAPSAVTRLVDMGLPRFLVGASLVGVLAQRLVRRVCSQCAAPVEPDAEERRLFRRWLDAGIPFADAAGCEACGDVGYKGRLGVHELLTVDRRIQRVIAEGGSDQDIGDHGARLGYRRLWEDGLEKVTAGDTTLRELAQSVGIDDDSLTAASTEA